MILSKRVGVALSLALVTAIAVGALFADPQDRQENGPKTWDANGGPDLASMPRFAWSALAAPSAQKANLWMTGDGRFLRYTVYVDRAGVPDWIHAMADEKLGKGEDLAYEIEVYPDGAEVYELYRKVDGKEKQLSVRADRSLYYIGTEQDPSSLPEAVSGAIRSIKNLKVEKCILKEGPKVAEYHLKATVEGTPCRVRVSKSGELIAVHRKVPAEIEVPFKR